MPISGNGMVPIPRIRLFRILGLSVFLACLGTADAAKKKSKAAVPLVTPASKQAETVPTGAGRSGNARDRTGAGSSGQRFPGIEFQPYPGHRRKGRKARRPIHPIERTSP